MATYNSPRSGIRKHKLNQNKLALKQLDSFGKIMNNMNILNNEIDNYNGVITEENLESICNLINLEKSLSLTEDQIKIVMKSYE